MGYLIQVGPDTLRATTLTLELATDVERNIRVDIESQHYTAPGQTGRFGWTIAATPDSKQHTLAFEDLELPMWATVRDEDIDAISTNALAIAITIDPTKTAPGTGQFAKGEHERGWLRIDNVELVTDEANRHSRRVPN